MTLKEKFEQYAKQEVWENKNYNAEECVEIADEFAIGFAEWIVIAYTGKMMLETYNVAKLLEIYKKEKGL